MKIAQVEETAGRINLHKLILRDYNFRANQNSCKREQNHACVSSAACSRIWRNSKKTLRVFYGGLDKNRRAQHASSEVGGLKGKGTVKKRVWNFICRQTFPGRCNKTREKVGHFGELGVAAEGGRHGVPQYP